MTDPANGKTDALERNVERLLSRAEPEIPMPPEARERALRALLDEAGGTSSVDGASRPGRRTTRRRWSWLAAAAAAIVIATVFFWPGSLDNGVAWADVVRHLEQMNTLVVRVVTESVSPNGDRVVTRAMLYQKDPGQSRSETYPPEIGSADIGADWTPDAETAVSVVIRSRSENEATLLQLLPRERVAYRTHLDFTGEEAEARSAIPRDMVADAWSRLTGVASRRTRSIGERRIDGIEVVGFEADIGDVFRDPHWSRVEGVLRVWADSADGTPVEVEAEYRDERGGRHHTWFRDLEWNAPLDDALFRVPVESGWRVIDVGKGVVEFANASLREGVTLRIGPPGGAAVFTEEDVEAVVSWRADVVPGQPRPRSAVFLLATPEGERKLRAYTSEHVGETIEIDFNGETSFRIRIGGVIGRRLQIDVTPLGLTAAEFEAAYLE